MTCALIVWAIGMLLTWAFIRGATRKPTPRR